MRRLLPPPLLLLLLLLLCGDTAGGTVQRAMLPSCFKTFTECPERLTHVQVHKCTGAADTSLLTSCNSIMIDICP
jgi:hypothetical protein